MPYYKPSITYTLDGTGAEIPALPVTGQAQLYIIQGTAVASGNYAITHSGTPYKDLLYEFFYKGNLDITTNSTTFSIFGQSLNQNDLIRELKIICRYSGSAWVVSVFKDFKETGIIEAFHMSTNSIATVAIQDDAITTDKLADGSVTTIKIADDAVDKTKIAADVAGAGLSQAVGGELDVNVDNSTIEISADTLQVKNLGITTTKINDLAVTTGKIADLAVTTVKINDNAVTTVKVLDNNITNAKLAQMPTLTVKANITGGTANAADVAISSLFANDTTKWSLTGNTGTTPGTNFIGTTDNQDLVFKVNNIESGRINLTVDNVSLGQYSLIANTTGFSNVAIGKDALLSNTQSGNNVAIGDSALSNITTQGGNTAVGQNALVDLAIGTNNTAVGRVAADVLTSGSNNTCIGASADVGTSPSLNRIAIGYQAGADADFQFALPDDITELKALGIASIRIDALPSYDDNADAITGGLVAGNLFVTTGSGVLTTQGVVCQVY